MLIVVTGEPGGSKTLNVIKMVCESDQFKNRPVYYHGIKELTLDWNELTVDQCHNWESLPDGSVIVVDEAQYVWPKRSQSSQCPDSVMAMSTHRHSGKDIILITQHPTLIDHDARKFCNQHWHFERPFNSNRPRRLTFQSCVSDPKDYHTRQEALVEKVTLDKKYFGTYKSTEQNTHKQKLPRKVYYIAALVLFFVLGSINFAYDFMTRTDPSEPIASSSDASSLAILPSQKPALPYDQLYKPRIAGLPHTAPIYDDLNKPVSRPMPNCLLKVKTNDCKCYSQQATLMDVPQELCLNIVKKGFFDPAKPDHNDREEREVGRSVPQQRLAFNSDSIQPKSRVVVLRGGHAWQPDLR